MYITIGYHNNIATAYSCRACCLNADAVVLNTITLQSTICATEFGCYKIYFVSWELTGER